MPPSYDVVVVGAGNAALCAALAARESGVSVLVLECAPQSERGGNSRFTAGAMRVAYNGVDRLARLMPDLTDEDKARNTIPHQPRAGRAAGAPQLRDHDVDAHQGGALSADLWAAGLQRWWPLQV